MTEILHKELSFKVVGILFDIYKKLGGGFQEKYYQKAVKQALIENDIPYLEQVRVDLNYNGRFIGRYYLDFLIDSKFVLEIKSKNAITRTDIFQVLNYLKATNFDLGIIANFTREGVKNKRILRSISDKKINFREVS